MSILQLHSLTFYIFLLPYFHSFYTNILSYYHSSSILPNHSIYTLTTHTLLYIYANIYILYYSIPTYLTIIQYIYIYTYIYYTKITTHLLTHSSNPTTYSLYLILGIKYVVYIYSYYHI